MSLMFVLPGDLVDGKSGYNCKEIDGKTCSLTKGYLSDNDGTANVINSGLAIPKLNDIALGICKFLTRKTAHIEIVMVERRVGKETLEIPIYEEYKGILRHVDVQDIERDSVVMPEKIRVGDIVRAFVISYGDNSVYLSTAHKFLGVVHAMKNDEIMSIVSQNKVKCTVTGEVESRKMAIVEQ
eukprot:NODE_320_length_11094_cov_0.618190.p5 type:complete len:183 gc:universal NODE_320_length_11094_cov_0.618190:9597-9049(-)